MRTAVLVLLSLFVLLISSCDESSTFVGSGILITEDRAVPSFTGVIISDGVEANIVAGGDQTVTLQADDNIIDRVRTEVSNGRLRVSTQSGNYRNITIRLDIVVPTVDFLQASDGANLSATGFTDQGSLSTEVSDGAEMTISGSGEQLEVRVFDGARLKAFEYPVTTSDVNLSDGANGEITVNNTITGRVRDGALLRYRGNPTIDVTVSDGGQVQDAN